MPTTARLLEAVLELSSDVHLEMREGQLVKRFLRTLADLFPGRKLALRVVDLRSMEKARAYGRGGRLRRGVESERISIRPSSANKTRLRSALLASARVKESARWDSPFEGVASGFAVPLVAGGELYGVLDVGYELGENGTTADESLILPLANHLSVALRNQRLHRETTQLRDSQARLIEQANALILGIGRDWRITVCNRALCELTGYSEEALMGRDLRDWLAEEERTRLTEIFEQALQGMGRDSVDAELATVDGGRVKTVWSVAAVGSKGRVQAVVAIGTDQTRLRELQGQIVQAEKLATLGQLAAGVVHELNNPLTSIAVYADFLIKKYSNPGVEFAEGDVAKIQQIRDSADRIQAFAKDLVQYAKPSQHKREVVSLNQVVKQSLSFCEHLFDRGRVALVSELADGVSPVSAVPGQIEQVIINLVTNAVHAIEGEGQVRVTTHNAGDCSCMIVSDTGAGIPPGEFEKVFEPFFTTKTDGRGTGLGLSIVRNIVEQHRGTIEVSRNADGGAHFTVALPHAK